MEPALGAARRKWVTAARRRLKLAQRQASSLRLAFQAGVVGAPDPASELIVACVDIVEWLHDTPAPAGLETAEAELGAAAGVFRNAAFAFRNLDKGGVERSAARSEACGAMLAQGEHHLEAFLALVKDAAAW
jgi:hypothetical protein